MKIGISILSDRVEKKSKPAPNDVTRSNWWDKKMNWMHLVSDGMSGERGEHTIPMVSVGTITWFEYILMAVWYIKRKLRLTSKTFAFSPFVPMWSGNKFIFYFQIWMNLIKFYVRQTPSLSRMNIQLNDQCTHAATTNFELHVMIGLFTTSGKIRRLLLEILWSHRHRAGPLTNWSFWFRWYWIWLGFVRSFEHTHTFDSWNICVEWCAQNGLWNRKKNRKQNNNLIEFSNELKSRTWCVYLS